MKELISAFCKAALSKDSELNSLMTEFYNNSSTKNKEIIENNKFLFIKTAEQARLANKNIKEMIKDEYK